MKQLLTVDELCRKLSVGKSTIYRWVQCDFVPYYKIGGLVRFDEEAVRRWLEKRHVTGRGKLVPKFEEISRE